MKRNILPAVVVCLFLTLTGFSQSGLRVNERQIKVFLQTGELDIQLPFENLTSANLSAQFKIELLDTKENVLTQVEVTENINQSAQTVKVSVPFDKIHTDSDEMIWYRLRYSVITGKNTHSAPLTGTVSLSEVMPEIFEIRAVGSEQIYAGMSGRFNVRAFQPISNQPMAGVKVTGEVSLDVDDEKNTNKLKLTAQAITGSDGYATLTFKVPDNLSLGDDGEINLIGTKNGLVRQAVQNLSNFKTLNGIYLNTDKPIYQPGQEFHVRGLYLSQTALSDSKVRSEKGLKFSIKDEDETTLYRETATTSHFGIASINWKIPENARLGTYRVIVESDDELFSDQIYFKVSRYDLPNFKVGAKPDNTFYLPGQSTAEITVSADYLFGKPVTKGAVRIVRENDRYWNYKEQKWETEEEESLKGMTDAAGKFVAKVDLTKAQADLKKNEYRRFEDLHYAAYYTDLSTNRTEQKRFDVRITKEAVHVYLIGIDSYPDRNPKLPLSFYVSTFYADGTPAECDLEIKGKFENEDEKLPRTLFKTKTNRFGAGRVEFVVPQPEGGSYSDLQLNVLAADVNRQTGTGEEKVSLDKDEKQLAIRTAKTIYQDGEAIDAEIISSEPETDVFIEIVKGLSVIDSHQVKIKNGRAQIRIPYRSDFKGTVIVGAYFDNHGEPVKSSKTIIYPAPAGLDIIANADKNEYRPGAEATVNFNITAFDKPRSENVLGVVVYDKAIDERAKTDAEFGGEHRTRTAFGHFEPSTGDSFGAINVSLLNRLDPKEKIPEDLQLAAEILLESNVYYPISFESDEYGRNQYKIFEPSFKRQFGPVDTILKNTYANDFTHPTDLSSLKKILSTQSINFDQLLDPWEMPYQIVVQTERDEDVLDIRSLGADKTAGSADDFSVLKLNFKYFTPTGNQIDQAAAEYHKQTGAFIRNYQTLRDQMLKRGIDLNSLKDRFGNPYEYKFDVDEKFFTLEINSNGKDGKEDKKPYGDDFKVWLNRFDYFEETKTRIQAALSIFSDSQKRFPLDEKEFKQALRDGGVNFDDLRDGYNRPLYLEFVKSSRYSNKVKIEEITTNGEQNKEKMTVVPITELVADVPLRSAGVDQIKNNRDDFDLATFSGIFSEQSKDSGTKVFTDGKGVISGSVSDSNGTPVPNITISLIIEETGQILTVKTDESGYYMLGNLPSGVYSVKADSGFGFNAQIRENVVVNASTLTEVDFTLQSGRPVTVDVSGSAPETSTAGASVSETQIQELPVKGRNVNQFTASGSQSKTSKNIVPKENSTPRLREYFPETLLWQPEIATDKNGKAQIKFKLGDNITTWKMYAIATDLNGKVGLAEKEIQAFQPFFVDLEPPKILTVGDEIFLPAQVRNYTPAAQKVDVSMEKESWFSFVEKTDNSETRQIEVAPNQIQNAIFGFRANLAMKAGKQKVTALAGKESDAIEKTTQIHPNGQEIVQTQSRIFRGSAVFDVNFPAGALRGTPQAALKIYPGLYSHVAESVTGLLERPYGCGEQTISSAYSNMMILRILKNEPDSKLKTQARKYLQEGYENLLGYQKPEGGFAVWTKDDPDVSLTAYALRFLAETGEFIEVDDSVSANAGKWLVQQQRADGSWTKLYRGEKTEDRQRTKMISTYVTRSLSMIEKSKKEKSKERQPVLQKAFAYLKERNEEINEPYMLANYALALLDAGAAPAAAPVIEKLESLAISESERTYWNLETNTPFYGWGTPGRIETTALVVQALVKFESQKSAAGSRHPKSEELISRGMLFLLKNKDRYGVWYSTQTTINVLDAILVVAGTRAGEENIAPRTAHILANGQHLKDILLPASDKMSFPLEIELPATDLASKIEVKIDGGTTAATAQIVQKHYIPWQNSLADGRNTNQSRQIRLDYRCDKLNAKVMEEINCSVEAERVGFQGYGMLLAEIGIPPGAEVDRESLEKTLRDDWSISRYDVLPDKIIVYMWAQPGGTRLNFKFRPRYAINAVTASSDVYDYYNEEAKATVAPLRFSIR